MLMIKVSALMANKETLTRYLLLRIRIHVQCWFKSEDIMFKGIRQRTQKKVAKVKRKTEVL